MLRIINEAANRKDVLRALRGNHLCAVTTYESNVPGYGSVPNTRYGVVLCLGTGRYQNEPAIRFFQIKPKNASWGQTQTPKKGSNYKILYLKDIDEFNVLPNTVTNPPPEFNPQDDRWFKTDAPRIVANFNEPNKPITVGGGETFDDKTETEKDIDQTVQIPTQSVKNKYDNLRKTTNELKGTYTIVNNMLIKLEKDEREGKRINPSRKKNILELLSKTKELFTKSQALTNKYWGIYKTETGKQNISIPGRKKTSSEKTINQKLKK